MRPTGCDISTCWASGHRWVTFDRHTVMSSQPLRNPAAPPHILEGILSSERLIFASDLVCLGTFRSRPEEPGFRGGQPCSGHTVVFPRRAVWIQHEGGASFVADAARVPLYNRGQVY